MNKGTQSLSKLYYSAYANTVLNKNKLVHKTVHLITKYLLPEKFSLLTSLQEIMGGGG